MFAPLTKDPWAFYVESFILAGHFRLRREPSTSYLYPHRRGVLHRHTTQSTPENDSMRFEGVQEENTADRGTDEHKPHVSTQEECGDGFLPITNNA